MSFGELHSQVAQLQGPLQCHLPSRTHDDRFVDSIVVCKNVLQEQHEPQLLRLSFLDDTAVGAVEAVEQKLQQSCVLLQLAIWIHRGSSLIINCRISRGDPIHCCIAILPKQISMCGIFEEVQTKARAHIHTQGEIHHEPGYAYIHLQL